MDFYEEMLELIMNGELKTKNEIHDAKISLCRKYNLSRVPSDADILEHSPEYIYDIVEPVLRTKPMRTISGVAPIAIMTSPEKCPHGTCSYCPGGIEYGSAQSYTGFEPAALRAVSHDFDPYLQTRSRLEQLKAIGHPTDKIDLIIMGGTFTARASEYRDWFVKGSFCALNNQPDFNPDLSLQELQNENETAQHRCIGMTIETRPDWCKESHVDNILTLGGTRVELGVQTTFDDILEGVSRGHTVSDSIEATRILKDSGLKVCFHLMPGLPGADETRDRQMFDNIFNDPDFKPDMLKIYPTLVVKGTGLYERWDNNEYEPLTTEKAIELIMHLKPNLPPWVRIQRIQRDIPVQYIEGGVNKSNLRQMVIRELDKTGKKCRCIRCREVGHSALKGIEPDINNIKLHTIKYEASAGDEVFMSYEDKKNDLIIAFVRLRLPSEHTHRTEFYINGNSVNTKDRPKSAIIRELKTFGPMVPFNGPGEHPALKKQASGLKSNLDIDKARPWQHHGYGKLLINASEQYVKENWDCKKLLIMSGVGVKQYYIRLGYYRDGVYMAKELT